MAYQLPILRSAERNTIIVSHPETPDNLLTYLSSPVSALGTTLTVQDNGGLAQDNFVIVGMQGSDRTEIVRITAAVTAGTSLTVGALIYDHPVDTQVKRTLWDQVEISGATTATGSKTVVATIGLLIDRSETTYVNTGTAYAFYFARFKNSNTSTFSAYSDAITAAGYAQNTVRVAKDSALDMINENVSDLITDQFLNKEVFNCEQEVWSQKKVWSWAYTFDSILSNTVEGQYRVALPSAISDSNSNKGVLLVRIGTENNLSYLDKAEWDKKYRGVKHTTVSTAIGVSDTTIVLTDSSDFASSGAIVIESDTIDYTGNTESTGTLTGVTNISATHAVSDDVWQSVSFGNPSAYTVFGGYLYFDVPISSTYAGLNIYLSYYRKPTTIDTDNDTLNIPDYSIYHYYLAWKTLLRLANGKSSADSEAMRMLYESRKDILMKRDRTGQKILIRPRLNTIAYPSTGEMTVTYSNQTV
jgi:hypothetical protein